MGQTMRHWIPIYALACTDARMKKAPKPLLWGFGAFFYSYCSTMGVRKERKLSLGRFLISWIWCQA